MRDRVYALTLLHGPRDWLVLAQVCVIGAMVPVILRLPLPRWATLVTRAPRERTPSPAEIARFERVIGLAPRIAHPLVKSGCLTRGLTLFWLLRRAGLDVELRFGLDAGSDEPADGHCWLTLGGKPYLERMDPADRFTELYRLPLLVGA